MVSHQLPLANGAGGPQPSLRCGSLAACPPCRYQSSRLQGEWHIATKILGGSPTGKGSNVPMCAGLTSKTWSSHIWSMQEYEGDPLIPLFHIYHGTKWLWAGILTTLHCTMSKNITNWYVSPFPILQNLCFPTLHQIMFHSVIYWNQGSIISNLSHICSYIPQKKDRGLEHLLNQDDRYWIVLERCRKHGHNLETTPGTALQLYVSYILEK